MAEEVFQPFNTNLTMQNKPKKQILDIIHKRIQKYVNLPLNERQAAFYELTDLEMEINKFFENEK